MALDENRLCWAHELPDPQALPATTPGTIPVQ
jgi:hypothetical protein